jgi:hypothetical protein
VRYTSDMGKWVRRLRREEDGFAALVIAIVLVLLLSLLTIGFAQLMRKEQRSATDKHLSDQAYYAAETGVNDAAKAINAGFSKIKSQCEPYTTADVVSDPITRFLTNNNVDNVSGSTGISYPCLIIDPAPKEYDSFISDTQSKVVEITGTNPADITAPPELIKELVISWEDTTNNQRFVPSPIASAHKFLPANQWTYNGVLRIGITPLSSGAINRDGLINGTYDAFLYPNDSGSPSNAYSYTSGLNTDKGVILDGNCSTDNSHKPRYCSLKIANFNASSLLVSLRSVYAGSLAVTITANGYTVYADGSQLRIKNAQTLVDSTGKAQDVLKRIQVRIPSKPNYPHSDAGIDTTGSICKQLQLAPNDPSSRNDCSP